MSSTTPIRFEEELLVSCMSRPQVSVNSTQVKVGGDREQYKKKMYAAMNGYIEILNNDIKNEYCAVSIYYDFEKERSILELVDNSNLCKHLLNILKECQIFYDHGGHVNIEMEMFGKYCCCPTMDMVSFAIKVSNFKSSNIEINSSNIETPPFRFASNDDNALKVIRSLLAVCDNKDDLNKLLKQIDEESDLLDCYTHFYDIECKKNGNKKNLIIKPREEIPREKTLSKKEKEKLKKQKAKEANKLREQEKKDKAKLAEQQAKQFEKQQKERERKRIETARKKKLALLKK